MALTNIIADFSKATVCETAPVYQYDRGRTMIIAGTDITAPIEVHFSTTDKGGEAITRTATYESGVLSVAVPNAVLRGIDGLRRDYNMHAYIYYEDEDTGATIYHATVPIKTRPAPADDIPDEDEKTALQEAIEALQHMPQIHVEETETGYSVTITQTDGTTETVYLVDGEKGDKGDKGDTGADGYSPTITTAEVTGGTQVIIMDKNGAHTFIVTDGRKGDKGDTGAKGDKGDKGDTGAKGDKGDKGDTGAKGDKGEKGDTGAKGDKGDKGDTGAQGLKGDKGDTGAQGQQGQKGDTGADGFSPVVVTEEITGGTQVTITDALGAHTFNVMDGAKGDKGDTGAKGDKGEKGDTGAKGNKGDKGDTGAQGLKGDKGADGKSAFEIALDNGFGDDIFHATTSDATQITGWVPPSSAWGTQNIRYITSSDAQAESVTETLTQKYIIIRADDNTCALVLTRATNDGNWEFSPGYGFVLNGNAYNSFIVTGLTAGATDLEILRKAGIDDVTPREEGAWLESLRGKSAYETAVEYGTYRGSYVSIKSDTLNSWQGESYWVDYITNNSSGNNKFKMTTGTADVGDAVVMRYGGTTSSTIYCVVGGIKDITTDWSGANIIIDPDNFVVLADDGTKTDAELWESCNVHGKGTEADWAQKTAYTSEVWQFVLLDGTTVTKKVVIAP